MAKIEQFLVSNTTDDSEHGADHAFIRLTKHDADFLLGARTVFRHAMKSLGTNLYCIELFWWNARYGRVKGYTYAAEGFERAAVEPEFARECLIESETVKILAEGVIWSATHKNGGDKDFFETPILPWTEIERVAEAKTVKQLVGILPAAHFEDSSDDDAGTTKEDAEAANA